MTRDGYISMTTRAAKRCFDVVGALFALGLTAPLFPLIALAVCLESPGPVLFRQLRVGRALPDRTVLFEMIKFRTMRYQAEKQSGPVWASENDPRVTRVGRVLRRTRLDELPQLVNVLRGEMSLIGPRPERPGIFDKLDQEIPFYGERIYGVRPGITGLAQVYQGYDRDIEDVRCKLAYDHGYAFGLAQPWRWFLRDLEIAVRTLVIMLTGRGQ